MEVRVGRAAIVTFALYLISPTLFHYIEQARLASVPAVVLATAVVALYIAAGCTGPRRSWHRWSVGVMALLVYLPLPLLGEWWAASGVFLVAMVLGLLPWRLSLPVFVLVCAAETLKSMALGDGLPGGVTWTLTVLVAAVPLAGLTHFAETARELYATRAELVTVEVAAQRARAMRELEGILGNRLDAIADQGRRVVAGVDGDAETVKKELAHMLDMAREAQKEMRGFAHREQRLPSGTTDRYP
ncbi:hypothetical protein Sme01_61340 [Sphaerisporangium melleum]|uniref:Histidine kinase n=1 Tax=Sphaerisporangium melleum TaxID=321316 RepID=A0A917VN25_9ACTN|nr:hypothetical protein GCM10007964_44960 [Sphaerisporangium melleum]GII73658.1 hypothetical protein Sme01_61340 [Sphaerisporangium melleum]